jgi:hypothetical protein
MREAKRRVTPEFRGKAKPERAISRGFQKKSLKLQENNGCYRNAGLFSSINGFDFCVDCNRLMEYKKKTKNVH